MVFFYQCNMMLLFTAAVSQLSLLSITVC